MERSEFM